MQIYHWLNRAKERFYYLTVLKKEDNIIINYHWGSCSTLRGGKKIVSMESENEASTFIQQMIKRRKSRGYELITPLVN